MDIQNNNVSIQINVKDLNGKQLRVADCDIFIVHVYTDDPKFYLVFSKRDILMTEWVDELVVPKHQMEMLQSSVVSYQVSYLPKAHDCKFEEDRVEEEGAYHPHRHRHEDLIHCKPVVTSIYWRNIKHPHPVHPVNSVTLFDIERLYKLVENERVAREKDFEALQGQFTEEFDDKLDAEIERSTTEDEKVNTEIEAIKSALDSFGKETEDKNEKLDEDIKANALDITTEVARATQKEIELEQLIQGEVARAKSAEEVIETKITMEKERAGANESNINDRLVSLTDRFDANKELVNETLKSEIERAKAVESSLNDRISGVVKDLADEVSRAAQKDIEHTNLVETESNRAKAVENKIATDLETETGRAKDAEKHILDEVHTLQDNVASLATATNVYNKAEVDTKISAVRNDVSTLENWVANHTDNTDELKTKVASLVEDVDKAKADILQEVAKCDAENNKLATQLQTVADSTYTKAEVDTKVSEIDSSISTINNWIANHSDNTEGLAEKVNKNISDIQTLNVNLATEINDRQLADTSINAKADIIEGKTDAEITRAKSAEKLISDELADYKTNADAKHSEIETAIAGVNADLTLEIARAKAAEKVNADAIAIINGDVSTAGSIKKSFADSKDYTDAEIAKLSLAKDAEIADTLKVYAKKTDVDTAIQNVIGTAPEALDTLGKISNALSADSDAITAINGVLAGKANADEVYTKPEIDTQITGVNNIISTLETKVDNADSALSSRIDDINSKISGIELNIAADSSAFANALADEINRAKTAEKANSDKLTDEVDKLNTKISEVNATLIADIASSTAKDTELEAKIDANSGTISSEIARAKSVESELNEKINSINLNAINTTITALDGKVDAEVARAKAAEKEITDSLETVSQIVESAIEDLNNLFDSSTGEGSGSLISGGNIEEVLDDYYTKDEVNDALVTTTNYILSGVYSKSESDDKYQSKGDYLTADALADEVYTKSEADARYLRSLTMTADEYEALVEADEIDENVLYIIL